MIPRDGGGGGIREGSVKTEGGIRYIYQGGKWVRRDTPTTPGSALGGLFGGGSTPKVNTNPAFNIDTDKDGVPDEYMEGMNQDLYNEIVYGSPSGDSGGGGGGGGSSYAPQPDPWTSTRDAAEFDASADATAASTAAQVARDAAALARQQALEDYATARADQLADDKAQAIRDKEATALQNKFQLTRDENQRLADLKTAKLDYDRRKQDRIDIRKETVADDARIRKETLADNALQHTWDLEMESRKSASENARFQAELADKAADRDQRYELESAQMRQTAELAEKSYQQALELEGMRQRGDITLEGIRQSGAMEQLKYKTEADVKMKLQELESERYNTFVEMLGKDPVRAVLFGLGLGPQAESFNQQAQSLSALLPSLAQASTMAAKATPTAASAPAAAPASSASAPAPTTGYEGMQGINSGDPIQLAALKAFKLANPNFTGAVTWRGGQIMPYDPAQDPSKNRSLSTSAFTSPAPAPAAPPAAPQTAPASESSLPDPRVSTLAPIMSTLPGAEKLRGDTERALSGLLGKNISIGSSGVSNLGNVEQAATQYQRGDENIQQLLASAFGIGDLGGAGGMSAEAVAKRIQDVSPTGIGKWR